ncbi:Gfo/Idh/MocA family oxidoreductase [Rugosimonospora acidiphila]|uniref:Gfo/Idh/MocA family oxidoreductase n=1 Tax=Rugosimonospora acidiphila TaxID=556531 RepID=A0ABP9RSH3_9ACTN
MRVGIIGYGLAGRVFHGRLLAHTEAAEVVAVTTRDPERQAAAERDFPGLTCFRTVGEMLATARLDLAVVATVPSAHPDNAIECLSAGVATVVDKPLAVDAGAAAGIVAAAGDTPLTVFQNRRWDADQLTLRRLLSHDRLGHVLRYESRLERWRPLVDPARWRDINGPAEGGGVLLDLGSHLVDQALTLFGPVRSVYGEVATRRGGQPPELSVASGDDDAFVALEHADGTRSHLWCSSVAATAGPRLRVLGSAAGYVVDEVDGQEDSLRAGAPAGEAAPKVGWLVRGAERESVDPERGRWDSFYSTVGSALRDGGPMPVDPMDAVRALEVIDAARRSARNTEIVRLG